MMDRAVPAMHRVAAPSACYRDAPEEVHDGLGPSVEGPSYMVHARSVVLSDLRGGDVSVRCRRSHDRRRAVRSPAARRTGDRERMVMTTSGPAPASLAGR